MAADEPDITERPTLTLIEDDDHEPFNLTRGDWRGLWKRFDQVHRAQQALGDQMGEARSGVHDVKEDMAKLLVATTTVGAKLSLVKLTREVGVVAGAVALCVLAGCGVALTGRYMGWW